MSEAERISVWVEWVFMFLPHHTHPTTLSAVQRQSRDLKLSCPFFIYKNHSSRRGSLQAYTFEEQPTLPVVSFSPSPQSSIQYAQLASKWYFYGLWYNFCEKWIFLLIFVSGKVSSRSSCRRSNSRSNAGSFQMLFSSLFLLTNWQLDFFYNFLLASQVVW